MYTINRSALTVVPAKPFLDWLQRVDSTSAELTLEDLRQDPSIYLLPEYDTDDQAERLLSQCHGEIFEEQLDGWHRARSVWPGDRSFDTFRRWFEYSFHSLIYDLCDDPLVHDDI